MANVRYSGGRSATLGTKTIDENGVYNASSDELDGYSEVTVDVPQPSGSISLSYNANGTYSDVDVENYEKANIQVDVPVPAVQTQEKEIFAQTNQVTVLPDSGKYLSRVIVQPQRNLNTYTPVPDTSNNDMGIINNYRYVNTQGMITPTGTKEVEYTTNGTHTEDIKNYENIDIEINVPVTGDLGSKTIIANGTYQALDDNLDGYDEVIVDVPQNATLGVKNITANGDYYASADSLDGFSRVSVAVPGGGSTLQANKTVTATTSQQIVQPDVGYDGLQQVTVNPQEHTATYTPAENTAANDMGVNNNYRYVDTSGMYAASGTLTDTITSGGVYSYNVKHYTDAQISVILPYEVKMGTITGSANEVVNIDLGFKPKKIFIYNYYNANKYISISYDSDVDNTYQYMGYRSTSSSSAVNKYIIGNGSGGTIQSISNYDFTYKVSTTFNPIYYVAIGDSV